MCMYVCRGHRIRWRYTEPSASTCTCVRTCNIHTTLQFRRQKSSAVSKLRRYIMKKLLSFTRSRSHSKYGSAWPTLLQDGGSSPGRDDGMEIGGEATEETMETAELVIDTGTAKSNGGGDGGGGEGEGG